VTPWRTAMCCSWYGPQRISVTASTILDRSDARAARRRKVGTMLERVECGRVWRRARRPPCRRGDNRRRAADRCPTHPREATCRPQATRRAPPPLPANGTVTRACPILQTASARCCRSVWQHRGSAIRVRALVDRVALE
jgi:hypothetical protein